MATRIFTNGSFFTGDDQGYPDQHPDCMIVTDSQIVYVGNECDDVVQGAKAVAAASDIIDLQKRIVAPGFIDAHVHILFFGLSLLKLDLEFCTSLQDIRTAIALYAREHPNEPRILCRGWQHFTTKGQVYASTLDDLDPRPIFVEALDLHSTWCNTAALNELPVSQIKQECPQYLPCDLDGNPLGLVSESAMTQFVWPFLVNQCSAEVVHRALDNSFKEYMAAGYTGIIDMAMDQNLWDALEKYRCVQPNGKLPLHVAAHWFVSYDQDAAVRRKRLDEAIAMHEMWHPSKQRDFCIVGIKLINDGVVDGCTAALTQPYGDNAQIVHPIWPREAMMEIVATAASAGMQCAIHAIGDAAVTQAIDSIAAANDGRGRHRIEHLEVTTAEDALRLGKLGITASVQPIHSDPARLVDYAELIGPEAFERCFAYKEFLDGHACVAIGSDAPTATHHVFSNLYTATTRKSVSDRSFETLVNPSGALTLPQAMAAATRGAAYSRFADTWVGRLSPGLQADFVILDTAWDPEKLLDATVHQTWSRGTKVYESQVADEFS